MIQAMNHALNPSNHLYLALEHLCFHPFNNILLQPNDSSSTDLNLLWKTTFFHMGINESFPNTGHLNHLREPEETRYKSVLSQGKR